MGRYKEYEICKFLELYKRSECLWKCGHKHYRLKSKRNEAYLRIRDAMNLASVLEVKQKIKSFRDTYASERTKVRRSAMVARHASEIYKPKLRWYCLADSFLNNPEGNVTVLDPQARNPNNTANAPPQESEAIYSGMQTHPPYRIRLINNDHQFVNQIQQPQVHAPQVPEYHQIPQHFRPPQAQRNNNIFHPMERSHDNLIQQTGEFYHFGMNIAMQLSSLPLVQALNVQTKIQQMLCEERIAHEQGRYEPAYDNNQSQFEEPVASSFVAENLQTEFQEECISLIEEEDHDIKEKFIVEEVTGSMPSTSDGF